jgi:hypothetical protein
MRARLLFVMIAAGGAVSAATACSSPDVPAEQGANKTTQASSVTVAMFDRSGNELGSCSGALVAKDLVLTAGHCAAGAAKWKVTSKSASTTVDASKAVTPWKAFGSNLSHPDHSDVAVIVLDSPIALDKYPAIATSKMADGTKAVRFSRSSASAAEAGSSTISVSSARSAGFRLDYSAKVEKGGFLDTGGAVIDPSTGKIHGVVSGMGNESGMLHIARTDNFAKWIAKAVSCSAATTTRTYPGGGSSGGSSSGGYGGGGGSSSGGWGNGGGDWGGYGGSGPKLDGGVSSSSGGSADGGGTTGGGTSSGGTPGSSGGTTSGGTPGSSSSGGTPGAGGSDTSGGDSSCPGVPTCEGNDCPGKKGGTGGSSGTDGTNPGGSSGTTSGGTTSGGTTSGGTPSGGTTSGGTTSGGTTSGANGTPPGGDEVCPGPPSCPEADSQSCVGAACGGCAGVAGCVDATIDYGSCASCGSSGSGKGPVVR